MIITKADYGKYLVIKSKLVGDTFEKLSTLPGFKKWIGRDLLFDPTGANIDRIRKYFPEAEWDESASPALDQYISNLKEMEANIQMKKAELPSNDDYDFKTKPFEHQRKAFYMSRDKKAFALLMEQGTGKTKVIIDNAAYLYAKGEITSLVVIAPNGVHRNCLKEIDTHMPEWCIRKSFY